MFRLTNPWRSGKLGLLWSAATVDDLATSGERLRPPEGEGDREGLEEDERDPPEPSSESELELEEERDRPRSWTGESISKSRSDMFSEKE